MTSRATPIIATTLAICLLLLLAGGCVHPTHNTEAPFASSLISSPVPDTATDQKLTTRPDGSVVLSWWQSSTNDKRTLLVSVQHNEQWSTPSTVSEMTNVVEAQVVPVGDDALAALWMVSRPVAGGEGEGHEIYVSRGDKSGQHWTTPLRLNQEPVASGKESPTLTALPDGSLLAAWIDQRHLKMLPPLKPGEEMRMEGYTSLIVASVSADNKLGKELIVDKDFCNCCSPALVADGKEALLTYRAHLEGNVRDPAMRRVSATQFGEQSVVHDDHWVIEGCPSRGPAVTKLDKVVAMAWLTAVKDKPRIRMAFSHDGGRRFGTPIDLEPEAGVSVSGVELEDAHTALVAWTTASKEGESSKLARVHDDGRVEHRTTVHSLTGGAAYKWPGPKMTKSNGAVLLSWNDEAAKKMGLVKVEIPKN